MSGPICILVIVTVLHYFYVMDAERFIVLTANAEKELAIIL